MPFHFEVLESLMFLTPEQLHLPQCDRLKFDFAQVSCQQVCDSEKGYEGKMRRIGHDECRYLDQKNYTATDQCPCTKATTGWIQYFHRFMKPKYASKDNNDAPIAGDLVPWDRETKDSQYAAIVEASCYCQPFKRVEFLDWIQRDQRRHCVLHRKCPQTQNDPRFLSVNPFNPRFFLPNKLPFSAVSQSTSTRKQQPPYRICSIGNTERRNFGFLNAYFQGSRNQDLISSVVLYGTGEFPSALYQTPFPVEQKSNLDSFVNFQRMVSQNCDILVALLDKQSQSKYFTDSLSGIIAQASAYNLPFVLHEELADLYKEFLPDQYQVHSDDNESFVQALDRMLETLQREQSFAAAEARKKDRLSVLLFHWKQLKHGYLETNGEDPPMQVLSNFIPRNAPLGEEDVVVATQVTVNKLDNLLASTMHWKGPMSVAVYISNLRDATEFVVFVEQHKKHLKRVAFHLLLEYPNPQKKYPINILRNLAMDRVDSPYFVALDVDHIPSPNSYGRIRKLLLSEAKIASVLQNKTLFVLPAFEVFPANYVFVPAEKNHRYNFTESATVDQLPTGKAQLQKMVIDGHAEPFRRAQFVAGQKPTDYEKWLNIQEGDKQNSYYQVEYEDKFEPYVLGYKPEIPRYWPHYRGSHNNKVSWFRELDRAGYKFAVLNDVFVTHLAHPLNYDTLYEESHMQDVRAMEEGYMQYLDRQYGPAPAHRWGADTAQATNDAFKQYLDLHYGLPGRKGTLKKWRPRT